MDGCGTTCEATTKQLEYPSINLFYKQSQQQLHILNTNPSKIPLQDPFKNYLRFLLLTHPMKHCRSCCKLLLFQYFGSITRSITRAIADFNMW